jgi:hypothetical protein
VDTSELVADIAATAVGAREGGSGTYAVPSRGEGRAAVERLSDYLRDKTALIVLDNCEHVRDACSQLAGSLLRECPRVTIIATTSVAVDGTRAALEHSGMGTAASNLLPSHAVVGRNRCAERQGAKRPSPPAAVKPLPGSPQTM